MSDYGLQDAGFVRKRLDEILTSLGEAWSGIFGANADTDPDSPDGQQIGLFAGAADETWDVIEAVATILDPQQSRGARLDATVQLNGITRNTDQFTQVTVTLTGTVDTTIRAGTLLSTGADEFATDLQAIIGGGGTATATATAVKPGPVQAAAGTLTTIVTPISGLTSVTNAAAPSVIGALRESDPELRARRESSTELGAVNTHGALVSALTNVLGVLDVLVLVNETLITDGDGVPGKSYEAVVDGGSDQDIADALWANHPMGIASAGSSSGVAVDSEGGNHTMNFERPADKDVWVTMTLTTDANFPTDGDVLIKQALVDYAAGQLEGHEDKQLGIGDDVLHSRLYTAINSVPGHTVDSLFIDFSTGPVATADLPITDEEISRWDVVRMVVNT